MSKFGCILQNGVIVDIITSLDNASVKEARSLHDKKFRRYYGKFIIEGKKQVTEAIAKGIEIDKLFVDSTKADMYENLIVSTDAPVLFVSSNVFKSISDTETPQGILATAVLPVAEFYKHNENNKALVLDKVSDPGNMGAIIRTACAVGIQHIFTIDCVDPYSPKVIRSSSGGLYHVKIYPTDYSELLAICKKHNIELLVADMHGENIYDSNFAVNNSYALVIGNEGKGVSAELKAAGRLIKLPMKQEMESLNAGVSASIILYALEGKNI